MDPRRSSSLVRSVLDEAMEQVAARGTERVDDVVKESATRILRETQGMRTVDRLAVFAAAFEVTLRQYLLMQESKSPRHRRN